MMLESAVDHLHQSFGFTRRRLLQAAGAGTLSVLASPLRAEGMVDFHVPGGPSQRKLTDAYPQKRGMILQRSSPPWLETPFETFDEGVFTPNDQHFVSWHYSDFPNEPDLEKFRLVVRGHVNRPLSLTVHELLNDFPRIELAAVAQCAGNSRLYMEPRVAGAQWANGSMSNALWTGIPLKAVLDRAGVKAGAVQVRFGGMDNVIVPESPKFLKSIDIDHARDGEVMIAFGMNGEQLPLLNGFPFKLVVPGWCAVYWIKMLNDIEVLDQPDTNYWTARGYRFPTTPNHTIDPEDTGFRLTPITRNFPRSFITNIHSGDTVRLNAPTLARGMAFGGDCGVAKVDLSLDDGKIWQPTELGEDEGKYGFRQWQARFTLTARGDHTLTVRCTNANGEVQPAAPVWNPGGYMRNTIESITVRAA
jgi:DMSO/TMAO reductase YedYZ molybdopterin-dependent catalytic subunit